MLGGARSSLDKFMSRLHSKKKMLTRDKEKHLQYKRQKVSAILVIGIFKVQKSLV